MPKYLMKAPRSSLEDKIEKLRKKYEKDEELHAYDPSLFAKRCPKLFNIKVTDFCFMTKNILIQNFFIDNNNSLTVHYCNVPIPHPIFFKEWRTIQMPYQILSLDPKKFSKALNMFFNDDSIDEAFRDLHNNYLINVVFPTFHYNFISDEYNQMAKDTLLCYLENFGIDGFLEKLLGSIMISSFYAVSSIEDAYFQNIVHHFAKDGRIEDLTLDFVFKCFFETFVRSLSCFSEHIIDLIKLVASKDSTKVEKSIFEFFLIPTIKRIIHSPYFIKTTIYKRIMEVNESLFNNYINSYLADSQKIKDLFTLFWKELNLTAARAPFRLDGVALSNYDPKPKTFFSVLDVLYLEKLASYVDINHFIDKNWPKNYEKDINCFQNAFYIFPSFSAAQPFSNNMPVIQTLVVKPSEEQMKKKWDMIHEQIVNDGISPIEEFVSPKYSLEFIRLALECEINILSQTKEYKDNIRDRMLNMYQMNENLEAAERVLEEVSLYYSNTYQVDYSNFNSALFNELFNYLDTIGMEICAYYASDHQSANLLVQSFRKTFSKTFVNLILKNDENNLNILYEAIIAAVPKINGREIRKDDVSPLISEIAIYMKMFHLYLQNQSLINLDKNNFQKAEKDNLIEAPPAGVDLKKVFNELRFPIDYLRAIVILHCDHSSGVILEHIHCMKIFVDTMNSIIDTIIDHYHYHDHDRVCVGQSLICFMFNNDLSNDLFISFSTLVNCSKFIVDNNQSLLYFGEDLIESINVAYSWFNKK